MNYDRIILELMDRISALEDEVTLLKKKITEITMENTDDEKKASVTGSPNKRDTTRYIFKGSRYGKNRLVLAIVQEYMRQYPTTSAKHLMMEFDRSLQGSLGVVRTVDDVKNSYIDSDARFFLKTNEIIHTTTEDCAVCTQWGAFNIGNILKKAEQLGLKVIIEE